ncbi:MAG: ASCH domain-containing protein [Faecousia sp.]
MNAKEMWDAFSRENSIEAEYQVWAFGGAPDKLARLTLDGIKTATASAFPLFELEGEPLPKAGDYSVILDSGGEAVCVIRTTRVDTVPFDQVGAEQAYKEGEGDRSLNYWRMVHEAFFSQELEKAGLIFDPQMRVVCEEFVLVYPGNG